MLIESLSPPPIADRGFYTGPTVGPAAVYLRFNFASDAPARMGIVLGRFHAYALRQPEFRLPSAARRGAQL